MNKQTGPILFLAIKDRELAATIALEAVYMPPFVAFKARFVSLL